MQYIVVFSGLVTIIVGLIAAYEFIKSIKHPITRRPGAILGVITVILIVFTVVLANSPLSRGGGTLNPTPGTNQLSVTTTVTQQIPSPISTPTPVPPTPKPTSVIPGTVLYQENGSNNWQGWALSADWKVIAYNNLLINNGSSYHGIGNNGPTAIAPYNVSGLLKFAVEVKIKSAGTTSYGAFGINVCGSSEQGSWAGYKAYINYYSGVQARIAYPQQEVSQNFDPGTTWHAYRVEVRANSITFLIDGATIATATDETFLTCGEQIGLWSETIPISVSSFKVIAL